MGEHDKKDNGKKVEEKKVEGQNAEVQNNAELSNENEYKGRYRFIDGMAYGFSFGDPLNAEDMALALKDLDKRCRSAEGAKKTINPVQVAKDYAILLELVNYAEELAKNGDSRLYALSPKIRQVERDCLTGTGMLHDDHLFDDPTGKSTGDENIIGYHTLEIAELHDFLDAFNYVIYRRIMDPTGDLRNITRAEIDKSIKGHNASLSKIYNDEARKAQAAIKDSWTYSDVEPTEEQKKYIDGDDGLRHDLFDLYCISEGKMDCDVNRFKKIQDNIMTAFPDLSGNRLPAFKYPTDEKEKKTPVTLRNALEAYKKNVEVYIKTIEYICGEAEPKYQFDFKKYWKDIKNFYKLVKPDAFFDGKADHERHIKEVVKYINSNADIFKAIEETKDKEDDKKTAGNACKIVSKLAAEHDFFVEKNLVRQIDIAYGNIEYAGANVIGWSDRENISRKTAKENLERYSKIPEQEISNYIDYIIEETFKEDYKCVRVGTTNSVRGNTFLNWVDISEKPEEPSLSKDSKGFSLQVGMPEYDRRLALRGTPFFEETVLVSIYKYCQELNLLTKEEIIDNQTKKVNLDTKFSRCLNILGGWLSTTKSKIKLHKDDVKTQDGIDMFCDVQASLKLAQEIADKAKLNIKFPTSITKRGEIENGLRQFERQLWVKHELHMYGVIGKELDEMNEADKTKTWSKLNINTIKEAKLNHEELIRKAEENAKNVNDLIESKEEYSNFKDIYSKNTSKLAALKKSADKIETALKKAELEEQKRKERLKHESDEKYRKEHEKESGKSAEAEQKEKEQDNLNDEEKETILENLELDDIAKKVGRLEEDDNVINTISTFRKKKAVIDEDNQKDEINPEEPEQIDNDVAAADAANKYKPVDISHDINPYMSVDSRMATRCNIAFISKALEGETKYKHVEFQLMKLALKEYVNAISKYNIKATVMNDKNVQYEGADNDLVGANTDNTIAHDPDVVAAAGRVYVTCKLYMERHMKSEVTSDGIKKSVTGQYWDSGALRKQAAIAVMDHLKMLPEAWKMIERMDYTVTKGNYAESIHSSDIKFLATTLKETNKKKFYELNKKLKEVITEHKRQVAEDNKITENVKSVKPNGMIR